jgi:hypothetical protein
MSNESYVAVIVGLSTVIASSGFWAFLAARKIKTSAVTRLLMGLAYDKIASKGMEMINHGCVTQHEYEEFRRYLYEPYRELGGNGTAEKIMIEISKLPFKEGGWEEFKENHRHD